MGGEGDHPSLATRHNMEELPQIVRSAKFDA